MDNRKKLLLLFYFRSISRKKRLISKRRRLLKLMIFVEWHLIQSNFMGQICFQMSLLANSLYKKCHYWMTEYNQSWSENTWVKHNEFLINQIWQKELRIGPETFEYFLDMIHPGIEKMDTKFRKAFTVKKRLAVTLWRFSTRNAYCTISKVFVLQNRQL